MKKYEIVELKENGYKAQINMSRGANCISLRNETYGVKILREPDYTKELDNPYLYGMPILFPVNRIEGGRFEFEGRIYEFPINEPSTGCHLHGELHRAPFQIAEKSASRLVCVYRADEQNRYLQFPHAFEIRMEYELCTDGLHQKTVITNESKENMPVFLGFHTTFCADFLGHGEEKQIRVLAEISEEYERNIKNYLPTGKTPEFDEVSHALQNGTFCPFGTPISRHYKSGGNNRMMICDEKTNLRIVYENDANYPFRLIYNGSADEYICLEPQTCMANCPHAPFDREKTGFDFIEPGESKEYHSKIGIEEGDK